MFIIIILLLFLISKENENLTENFPNSKEDYKILNIFKRNNDSDIYTQGLFFSKDHEYIFESGGLYNKSSIIKLKYPSLIKVSETLLDKNFFGEGISSCGNYYYQLTWRENIILKYDKYLNLIEEINIKNKDIKEGWGLSEAYDNEYKMYLTNGSNKIIIITCENDVLNFDNKNIIEIFDDDGNKVLNLNDLVNVEEYFYINVYMSDKIIKVDMKGKIIKTYVFDNLIEYEINMKSLDSIRVKRGDVLNGIAYNKKNNSFLITGKKWGFMYEIKFIK